MEVQDDEGWLRPLEVVALTIPVAVGLQFVAGVISAIAYRQAQQPGFVGFGQGGWDQRVRLLIQVAHLGNALLLLVAALAIGVTVRVRRIPATTQRIVFAANALVGALSVLAMINDVRWTPGDLWSNRLGATAQHASVLLLTLVGCWLTELWWPTRAKAGDS